MPKAFVLVNMDVTDPVAYQRYKALSGPAVEAAGGRFVVRGGPAELLEGDRQPGRIVVLEFPDLAAARAWYRSPAYEEAKAARQGAATGTFVLVEGVLDGMDG